MRVADLNGDGKPDLVTLNFYASNVSVLRNTTAPGASTPTVSIADFNGDGKPDLAVGSQGANAVLVLVSTTAPGADPRTFAAHQDFPTGVGPGGHLAIGDLNNDGMPDLATANLTANSMSATSNCPRTHRASTEEYVPVPNHNSALPDVR